MNGPLGKYSQLIAAVVAVVTITTALAIHALGVASPAFGFVDNLALIAFGAIFGANASSAATNGTIGRDLKALHARLDAAGTPGAA